MKFLIKILLIIVGTVLFNSCNTTDPPLPPETKATLTLALEDTSCTEVWLQLKTKDLELPAQLSLKQYNQTGDSLSQIFVLNTQDSLLYIDSLLPNQNYSFQVSSIQSAAGGPASSNELSVRTMDTTSHNFTWQTFTFGDAGAGSSTLYDVAIIDENNIWAVGEIYMNDSLGNPDPTFYNAAHWNGQTWELKKLFYKGGIWTIRTVFAFNENDIWFSGYMRYLNGNFIELPIPNILMGWGINKSWGSSNVNYKYPNSLETPVVFTLNGANAQANLKGTQLTNTSFNPSKNSQRGFIKDTWLGYLHNVYESMGDIWYERSTDDGTTWYLMNNGKPINPDYATANASSPSVCFDANYNMLYFVYQSSSTFPYNGIVLA